MNYEFIAKPLFKQKDLQYNIENFQLSACKDDVNVQNNKLT